MRIRNVLIVDPTMTWPALLAAELDRARITVVGTVGYGLAALTSGHREQPHLVLIRVSEPVVRPIQLIQQFRDALPESAIIAVLEDCGARTEALAVAAGATLAVPGPMSASSFAAWLRTSQTYLDGRERSRHIPTVHGGEVIAVVGAKGGVGKTTIATNLAIALQQATQGSCALLDADPLFGDVALALDLAPGGSIVEAARALEGDYAGNLREFMVQRSGVWVLAAPRSVTDGASVTGARLKSVIDSLRAWHDFVVVDTGGAFSELTDVAVQAATTTLLVTTPDPNAVRDAAMLVKYLRDLQNTTGRMFLLQNRAGMRGSLGSLAVDRETGLPARWSIPEDTKLFKAMQAGLPFVERYPRSAASVAIRDIASTLSRPGGLPNPPQGPRLVPAGLRTLWRTPA